MHRRLSRRLGLAACLLSLVGVAALSALWGRPDAGAAEGPPADPPAAAGPRLVVGPLLQYPTRTTMTVVWETDVPGSSVVDFGTGPELKEKAEGPAGGTMHEVTLTGLSPNTNHVYRVRTVTPDGAEIVGPVLTFQTAVDADSAFSFALIGDTQRNPKVTGEVARLAWERRPNFVLHLGDVVDSGPDKKQWVDDLFAPAKELFGRSAVLPTIGNHERNHAHYYQYFALPEPEYRYHFRYGNADFYAVDSNRPLKEGSEQWKWLDGELARSDATWKFVFLHHPPFSSDDDDYGNTWKGQASTLGTPNSRGLVPLLERHRVDAVFNGHVHLYERTWPLRAGKVDPDAGILYLTTGGGGGKLDDVGPIPTWFKAEVRRDFHFCYATVHGKHFSCRAFDTQGRLFDLFDLRK